MKKLELLLPRLRNIPALLLWGDRDRAISLGSVQTLRQYFDRADYCVLPGTGHLPFEECPDALTAMVNRFLVDLRGKSQVGPRLVRRVSEVS
jgi:pimeloyl-ACP methyl ester carboxylesterase